MANEKRLIWDVDMKTAFREWFDHDDFRTMNQVIDDIPTVDAVEVKHGRWILTGEAEMSCSVCDDKYYGEWDYECMTPYCPGCGAKMDRLDGDRNG